MNGAVKVKVVFHDPREGYLKFQTIRGLEVPYERLTVGDLTDRLAETEARLSRLTGMRVTIETREE